MLKRTLLITCFLSSWTFTLTACVPTSSPEAPPTAPPLALPTTLPTATTVTSATPELPSTVSVPPTITEYSEQPSAPTEPKKITPTIEIETSNWKTYRDEQYGYEIKYPSTAFLSFPDYNPFDPSEEIVKVINAIRIEFDKESTWPGSFEIYVVENALNLSSREWIERLKTDIAEKDKAACEQERGEGAWERGECPATFAGCIRKEEEIDLNGLSSYRLVLFEFDHNEEMICLTNDNFIYLLSFCGDKENPNIPHAALHYRINSQILSTFKLIP